MNEDEIETKTAKYTALTIIMSMFISGYMCIPYLTYVQFAILTIPGGIVMMWNLLFGDQKDE